MTEQREIGHVHVREARENDSGQWSDLWAGYNQFYGRVGQTALPAEVTQVTWNRFFDADEPMHALVAEAGGKLIGLAHYLFHQSTTSIAPFCYLQDLFTAPDARAKGVATALIEQVADCARQARAARVYWHTHETNEVAQKLYEKLADRPGFIVFRKML